MATTLAYYQNRVPGLRKAGRELRGPCPVCQAGRDDAFALDEKTLRWCCHREGRGGDAYELEMALTGLPFPHAKAAVDGFTGDEPPPRPARSALPPLVATYDYRAADGTLVYQVTRHQQPGSADKTFRQRRPDPGDPDRWIWSLGDVERVLYRLPELLASTSPIYLVEGEKDADNARTIWGLNATTSPQGAEKFTAAMARSVAGRDVVILPDNDPPTERHPQGRGMAHAEKAAALLRQEGCRVKVVRLPAKDLSAWLEAGARRQELASLQAATPEWSPDAPEPPAGALDEVPANLQEMLRNYVILVGSDMIWDERLGRTTNQKEMYNAHARDFAAWVKHDAARKLDIDKLVFKPQGAAPGELNLFKGIRMRPDAGGSCQRMLEHVAFLCGHDPGLTRWLTCWLAYPLQHLGAKLRSAVVMYGAQGTGKSLLFETIASIYGEEHADIIGQAEVESPYTGWASRKLFVVADEVEGNVRYSRTSNKLKALITGDWIGIEEKYRQRRTEQNHLNMVFLSNGDVPVVVEGGDRRYAVFRVDRVHPPAYFRAILHEREAGGAEALYAYLLAYDLTGFDPNGWPPTTGAKETLAVACASPADRFLDEWAAGDLPLPFGCAAASDLYEAYRIWCVTTGERSSQQTETAFGRTVGKRRWVQERKRFAERNCRVYAPSGLVLGEEAIAFRLATTRWLDQVQSRRLP